MLSGQDRYGRNWRTSGPKTGLIMAVRGRNATVLVPGGAFLRLRLPVKGARPGDEVPLPSWAVQGQRSGAVRATRLMAVAAATMVVAILVTSMALFVNPLPAIAMVSVDINPSVGLWVNSLLRVVRVQAMDDDGAALLEGIAPGRRLLTDYLAELTERVNEGNTPATDRWLVLAATPLGDGTAGLSLGFMHGLDKAVERSEQILRRTGVEVYAAAFEVPPEVAVAAREAGVSPGRYTLVLAAAAAGVTGIDTDHVQGGQLVAAIRQAGVNPGHVISRVKSGDLRGLWQGYQKDVTPKGKPNPGNNAPGKPSGLTDPAGPNPGGQGNPPFTPPGQTKKPGDSGSSGEGAPAGLDELKDAGYSSDHPVLKGGSDDVRGRASEVLERLQQMFLDRFGPGSDHDRGPK
jgi:hypothetical protein